MPRMMVDLDDQLVAEAQRVTGAGSYEDGLMPYPHDCTVPIGGNLIFAAPGLPVSVEQVPRGRPGAVDVAQRVQESRRGGMKFPAQGWA